MFEKIVLRRSDSGPPISLGELAEALLFYQNVHLFIDYGSLNTFVQTIGIRRLLSLLTRGNVSAVYCEELLGTRTQQTPTGEFHEPVSMYFSGTQDGGPLRTHNQRLQYVLERHGHQKKDARKLVERFRQQIPIRKLTDERLVPGGILEAARSDLNDKQFVYDVARRLLSSTFGAENISDTFVFDVMREGGHFRIKTDIDFQTLNAVAKSRNQNFDAIGPAHILTHVLDARADTALAAHYGGEFYTSESSSITIRARYRELLQRIGLDKEELREFKEIVIPDMPSVREALNSGGRTFDEFLSLLDKSQKFREWVHGINPDEKVVQAYLRETVSQGWFSKLPSKMVRYVLASLVGAVSPPAGYAAAAADTFLLEKIFSGWRPNHFVDGRLKPFLDVQ